VNATAWIAELTGNKKRPAAGVVCGLRLLLPPTHAKVRIKPDLGFSKP
jgi:hypothetical protein